MVAQSVQLATREEEVYRGRVNNLSQAPHVLGLIREKFNEAELRAFEVTCFNYIQGVDELTFSGQLMHELSLRRVGNQGVKDPKAADPFNRRGKGRVEGDGEGDEEEEEEEVRGTKKVQRSGWGCKGFCMLFSYIENFEVEDNKEAADPRVVAIAVVIKEIVLIEALKELKVSFEWLAHEKEISDKNLVKKMEELSNVVAELRRVVMEKPVEENTKEEDEGKKDVGEKVEEDGEDEEEGKEEKK
ncbi:hypothetical protein C1H46_000346 [Malus baccata]|uniref:Uncharacterized protein n=1 Tax=Malus baccata TaxID=106549 RepID=A0A540NSN8_MALBA|nr:hypothetical protein C1H46_000346 [Malus baccata]